MINRMIEPTSGRILLDGTDIRKVDRPRLRRGIGYVIQHAGLFPHRTVLDNIATVPVLTGQRRKVARRRAGELLELVGLPAELAKRYPSQLSGGQQQRVGVARALAADPPVLLMDEPFSAVDPIVREGLQDELLRLQADLGKTIVFVTHDIDEAIKLGDKVAVLRQGGILAQYAAPAELLARPADDFVASFVGRDRGYRALGFRAADGLRLGRLPQVRRGTSIDAARTLVSDGWAVVVDGDDRPLGWVNGPALDSSGSGSGSGTGSAVEDVLVPGGSLYSVASGSLRAALDAALSSPSELGIAVDDRGAVVGSVAAEDVLAELRAAREAAAAQQAVAQQAAAQQAQQTAANVSVQETGQAAL
jgi:osmoprotectant transport system ATP-binding protein